VKFAVDSIYDVAAVAGERLLLLMLPGAKNTPQEFVDHGFISAVRERELPVDVLALDAHVDLYLERTKLECLLNDVLDEARVRGYRRVWLLGISLGGSGAMICATQRPRDIEGVILLAPFLGTRGLIAEIEAAGGLGRWHPGAIEVSDHERSLMNEIRCRALQGGALPTLYVGYGAEDRYRGASTLLVDWLPPGRVTVTPGRHDWETWRTLWSDLLESGVLR
jgi:pimeloyl-ACP methyl ester carboxylesterase